MVRGEGEGLLRISIISLRLKRNISKLPLKWRGSYCKYRIYRLCTVNIETRQSQTYKGDLFSRSKFVEAQIREIC